MTLQHLQSVCDFYYLFYKASHWHNEVLNHLSYNDALWGQMPMKENVASSMVDISRLWSGQNQALLSQMPPQNPDEWMELAKLSSLFPENTRTKAMQLSSRCILLWNILTSHNRQVCHHDVQQVMSWKQNLSSFTRSPCINVLHAPQNSLFEKLEDHVQERSFLGSNPGDFSMPLTKSLCEQKHFHHVKMQCEELLQGEFDGLNDRKCSHLVYEPVNPWLSLPLRSFSCGCKRQHNYKGHKYVLSGHRQTKNEPAMHDKTTVELNYRTQGIHISDTKRTSNCGIQMGSHHSFNIKNLKTPQMSESDVHCCVNAKKSNNREMLTNLLDCNRRTDWDLELETLCKIEDLLLSTEAILKEEESALLEEKEFYNLLQDEYKPYKIHENVKKPVL